MDAACGLTPLTQMMGLHNKDVSGLNPQKTNCLAYREENFLTHLRDKAEESELKLSWFKAQALRTGLPFSFQPLLFLCLLQ